jgi:predicted ATP-binding protein involved in virulence
MRVTRLRITNLRAIETLDLAFQPGFNLLAGVNGVGKTTILEALAVCLSAAMRRWGAARMNADPFTVDDIRHGTDAFSAECRIWASEREYTYLIHTPRDSSAPDPDKAGRPREEAHDTPAISGFVGIEPPRIRKLDPNGRPLAVLYSISRAIPADRAPTKSQTSGGVHAAYANAFAKRGLSLGELAAWINAQGALGVERPESKRVLQALEYAVQRFLPGYRNLRVREGDGIELVLDRGETEVVERGSLTDSERARLDEAVRWAEDRLALQGVANNAEPNETQVEEQRAFALEKQNLIEQGLAKFLPGFSRLRPDDHGNPDRLLDRKPVVLRIDQLSDGERGVLALVLDLTRRLAQANPELPDPSADAEAVVLIDEVDLHLHPRWQRQIVHNLLSTFPRCQFIATSHSPQVIGELEPECIQILTDRDVYSPDHSYGVDASRVLEEIMDTAPRSADVQSRISRLSRAISEERYDTAREELQELAAIVGENDPEVVRAGTLLDLMEGDE